MFNWISYMNECRAIRRETGIHKSKWAPKLAPTRKAAGRRANFTGVRHDARHSLSWRRQAEIQEAKHLATLDDYEIPF
jgi:hypothetical protein